MRLKVEIEANSHGPYLNTNGTMDLWNEKTLEPPPILTSPSNVKEIDIKFLRNILKDAIDVFSNQPHLFNEAAMVSRTIYRMKMKFRSSKDLKAIEKLNRSLRLFLHIRIQQVLKSFLDSVPEYYKANKTSLPSRHMIHFVLVRIQSLGKILAKIFETCKTVAILAEQRLRLGHFWTIAMLFYAMAARIFVISKFLIKYTCKLYTNLLPFASKLNNVGKDWLPARYVFPENLHEWLGIDWVDLETTVIEIQDDEPQLSYFDLIDDSDDDLEFCNEYILVRDDVSYISTSENEGDTSIKVETVDLIDTPSLQNINEPLNTSEKDGFRGFSEDVDIGEAVNASDVMEMINLSEVKTPQSKTYSETPKTKKQRRARSKKISNQKSAVGPSTSNNSINLTDSETPNTRTGKRRHSERINNQETKTNVDLLNCSTCNSTSLTDSEIPVTKKQKSEPQKKINNQETTANSNTSNRKKRKRGQSRSSKNNKIKSAISSTSEDVKTPTSSANGQKTNLKKGTPDMDTSRNSKIARKPYQPRRKRTKNRI